MVKKFSIFLLLLLTGIQQIYAQTSGSREAWYNKAVEYQNAEKYTQAIEWYSKVIEAGGYDMAYMNRSQCYFLTDQIQKGFDDLLMEQLRNPANALAFARYGYYTFNYTDSSAGIDAIRKAVHLDSLDYFNWLVGGIYFGINRQTDSMVYYNNRALNCLTDTGQILSLLYTLEMYSGTRPLLALEAERIKKEYEAVYSDYINANAFYHDIFVYVKVNDGEKIINSVEESYLYERECKHPRIYRLYYVLNYFHTLGQLLYKAGDYNTGKIFLDYEFRIANDIKEPEAWATAWSDKAFMHYYRVEYDSSLTAYRTYFTYKTWADSTDANIYATLVSIYCALAQYDSAGFYARKALAVSSRNDISSRGIVLNNVGLYNSQTGNYEEALRLFNEAATLARQMNDTNNLTLFLNNIGSVYQADGRYDKAENYFLQALELNKNNKPNMVVVLSNLGYLHTMWGNFKKAIEYCNQAMPIAVEFNMLDKVGLLFNNMSVCYRNLNQPGEAKRVVKEALTLFEKIKSTDLMALGYLNLGNIYGDAHELDSALYFYNKAMEINQALNKVTELGLNYDILASVYFLQKKYPEAEEYFLKAIQYDEASGRNDRLAAHYGNLATLYIKQGEYAKSETYFKKCIALFEEIRKTATGAVRREYFAQVIANYQLLSLAQIAQEHYADAFQTMELSKAKLLGEQLSMHGEEFKTVSLEEVQKHLGDSTAVYFYNSISDEAGYGFLIDKDRIIPLRVNDDALYAQYATLMQISDTGSVSMETIINQYRNLLLIPEVAKRSSTLLADVTTQPSAELREKLARLLYSYFFRGISEELKKYTKLIIVPDGIANFLPFESLIDSSNRFLAEYMAVGYIQSMSVESRIASRKYSNNRKEMIAFGGAEYVSSPASIVLKTKEARESVKQKAVSAIASRGNLSDSYTKLGYGSWQNLPGTITELQELKKIIPDCDEYTGKNVDESKIKALSAQGKLKNYRVIHFATHGMVVPEVPELSALVLTQTNAGSADDNYLRADEISKLELNADFVALSACETGLGKIYNGDGVVGLTQSFMIAGANSLAVSLWQVADQSTSQFMSGIYRLSASDHDYLNAIARMKQQFISGAFGEKYKAPYYWAPFIYYGR